ncbi:MAG: ABC transporter ATP-binding protein [Limnohabitans sp.]|nr:ABC transporter ATP-binding protein [Limnohabitans sp.]
MSETSVLSARGLCKAFGGHLAVDNLSFSLGAGEMLALIGPNGAGKSTTFNLLNGQLRADAGEIWLGQTRLPRPTPQALWRLGVSRTFQTAQALASFAVRENVQLALLSHAGEGHWPWANGLARWRDEAQALLEQVGLGAQADRPSATLAYGDVKRLELAMALANTPRVLLMDEPTAGMAPEERQALMALVGSLVRGRGLSVLYTEHSMEVVFGHADRILVMAEGRLLAEGTPEAVRANPQVQAVYLGELPPVQESP